MSEVNPAPEAPAQPIATDLQPEANAVAPAAVGVGGEEQQQPHEPGDQTPPEGEGQKPGSQSRYERRMDQLLRENREKDQLLHRLQGRLEAFEQVGRPQPQPQTHQAPAQAAEGPPNPDDYYGGASDPQFIQDSIAYGVQTQLEAREKAAAQRSEFQSGAERFFGVMDQAEQAAAESEHFLGAPVALQTIGRDKFTADLLTAAENPVHVAAYLGDNPGVLKRVMAMPQHQRAYQIAQIDLEISRALKAPAPQPAPAPSAAPAPAPTPAPTPTPILNGGRTPLAFDPNTASQAQFDERLRQLRAARQS